MLLKNPLVLLLIPLFLIYFVNNVPQSYSNYYSVFKVTYNFEIELRGFGPQLKFLYGEGNEYNSKIVVSIMVSYVYRMEVYFSTCGDIYYEYVLINFNVDSSSGVNRSFYEHLNVTLSRKLNVVEKGVNIPVDPKFILWINYLNASIDFTSFSKFHGNPRFILIDREVPAFYRIDVFENRNYTHSSMEYIAASYDAVLFTPLYLYYYSQISSNDASEQVTLKIVMRSSIEYDNASKYVVRSARAVFKNGDTASILMVMVGGEAALRIEHGLNELTVYVKVLNESSIHPYRLILVINNPSSTRLINTNGTLRLVSNTTTAMFSTELIKGDYALKLVFNQNVSKLELSQNNNVVYLIDNRPLNLSPQAVFFTILFNAIAIQLCFLLGKKLSKWLMD